MKKVLLASLLILALAAAAQAAPTVYPTGTVLYKPDKAYNGFLLIGFLEPMLIDMNGNLVKSWPGFTGMPNKALPGGHIMTSTGTWKDGQQDLYDVVQIDFDGKKVWEFRNWEQVPAIPGQPQKDGKTWISRQHHDYQRKGTPVYFVPGQGDGKGQPTLILGHINERNVRINKTEQLVTDIIYEVDASGKILWEWSFSEHLDEFGFDKHAFEAMQSYPPADNPVARRHALTPKTGGGYDWMHINCLNYVGPNRWYDADPVKYAAFHPDNVLFSSRDANMMGIVDRKSGKVAWRLGPDFGPNSPDSKIGQIVGQHFAHIIPKGLPGEGNLMFFDNGGTAGYGAPNPAAPITGFHNVKRDYSRVVEVNPVAKEIVWEYDWYKNNKGWLGHHGYKFFSPFVSSAQRLPNGNTMINEGDTGRVFEITNNYEMVWEYLPPYFSKPGDVLYRVYKVAYDWFPQIPRPEEVSVTPPANGLFHLPDDKGRRPKTGFDGKLPKIDNTEVFTGKAAPKAADEGGPSGGMHSY